MNVRLTLLKLQVYCESASSLNNGYWFATRQKPSQGTSWHPVGQSISLLFVHLALWPVSIHCKCTPVARCDSKATTVIHSRTLCKSLLNKSRLWNTVLKHLRIIARGSWKAAPTVKMRKSSHLRAFRESMSSRKHQFSVQLFFELVPRYAKSACTWLG